MEVEVVRSARRRRTVQARLVAGRLRVSIPAWMSKAEEQRWVDEMLRRWSRKADADSIDLPARAALLARRYRLPEPASIRWVDNQEGRWGSCTPADRTIRISSRLAPYPAWVLDYVLVHELAHLAEPGHGPRFRALERRFPKAERAIGFLLAKGLDGDDAAGHDLAPETQAPTPSVPPAVAAEPHQPRRTRPRVAALGEALRLPGL